MERGTYSVFLLSGDGSRRREHEPQNRKVSLFLLDETLERVDVKRYRETVDREDNRGSASVDDNLHRFRAITMSLRVSRQWRTRGISTF